jgi:hypothetical protein
VLIALLERSRRLIGTWWSRWTEALPGHIVGSLGALWTIRRIARFLGFG